MLDDDLRLSNYDYTLPRACIALKPAKPKEKAKLLVFERKSGKITHAEFGNLCEFLPPCAVVFNDTKVIKARIYGTKNSGAKCELLFHKALSEFHFLAQIKARVKKGEILHFESGVSAEILGLNADGTREICFFADKNAEFFSQNSAKSEFRDEKAVNFAKNSEKFNEICVKLPKNSAKFSENALNLPKNSRLLNADEVLQMLEKIGHIPLPPYIKRADTNADKKDYQSIFAKNLGAIAAPTASLHFSKPLLNELAKRHDFYTLTLHIGAGTFKGVECDDIRLHQMHAESYALNDELARLIDSDKALLGVGTTATRCIENYARTHAKSGECELFLHPKNPPIRQNYLLTNFHLPKSTLIMLVAAFIGRAKTLELYKIAIDKGYKFYSYGDAMLII